MMVIGSVVCIEVCGSWLLVIWIGVSFICGGVLGILFGDGVVGIVCVVIGGGDGGVGWVWWMMNLLVGVCRMVIGMLVISFFRVVVVLLWLWVLVVCRLFSLCVLNSSVMLFWCVYCCRVGVSGFEFIWIFRVLVCLVVLVEGCVVMFSVK